MSKALIVFILFLIAAVVFGIATYVTPAGAGRLVPFGLTLVSTGLAVGSFPG